MNEYNHKFKRGDFLIRGVMGIDPDTGSGAVADYVHVGQTIQFHLRDAKTAQEDLTELLNTHKDHFAQHRLKGAFVFSCNGRGENLFQVKDHDIKMIQQNIGPVPAAGFFCAGEIGPVGGVNFLHGFTSSITLIYAPK
jgi:small ligand-binding sensory domain FIST